MKKKPICIYLCNAIDDVTKSVRKIKSDSPAATKKVIDVSSALKKSGCYPIILSLGRGGPFSLGQRYSAKSLRVNGIPIIYALFWDIPLLTYIISVFSILILVWRLRKRLKGSSVVVYNRLTFYVLAVALGKILGANCYLDLEDGDSKEDTSFITKCITIIMRIYYNKVCNSGAILAMSNLRQQYTGKKTICCYGVASEYNNFHDWETKTIRVILGGTLQLNTGSQLFAETISYMRECGGPDMNKVEFFITGKGEMGGILSDLENDIRHPKVTFFGEVSSSKYRDILNKSHVGLSIKLSSSDISNTTFPSKVIELSSDGLLLLSTRISDVPIIFKDDGAIYIDKLEPSHLASQIFWIINNKKQAQIIANKGRNYVLATCSEKKVGLQLKQFLFQ